MNLLSDLFGHFFSTNTCSRLLWSKSYTEIPYLVNIIYISTYYWVSHKPLDLQMDKSKYVNVSFIIDNVKN